MASRGINLFRLVRIETERADYIVLKICKYLFALEDESWLEKKVWHQTQTGRKTLVKVKSLPPQEQERYRPQKNDHPEAVTQLSKPLPNKTFLPMPKPQSSGTDELGGPNKHGEPSLDLNSFFTKEENELPTTVQQPDIKSENDFYDKAQETHGKMLEILDRGKGLDKSIGAKHYSDFNEGMKNIDQPGPIILTAPLKGRERAREKVETELNNDWGKLTDGVRASVAVDNINDIHRVIHHLKNAGVKIAKKPTNRFANPTDSGYRDMLLNIQYPNGHIGELQIHTKPILKAKQGMGHKYYEDARSMQAKMFKENRSEFTPEELKTLEEINNNSKKLYEDAWNKSIKSAAKELMIKKGLAQIEYFDYNGFPAIWEKPKLPMVYHTNKPYTERNLWNWITYKKQITKSEFDKLMKNRSINKVSSFLANHKD